MKKYIDVYNFCLGSMMLSCFVSSNHLIKIQDFFVAPPGKRKREDLSSQYHAGGFIPQQDGAGDATLEVFEIEVCLSVIFGW